jgi:hypothetical protein
LRSSCLNFQNAEITGVYHHAWQGSFILKKKKGRKQKRKKEGTEEKGNNEQKEKKERKEKEEKPNPFFKLLRQS